MNITALPDLCLLQIFDNIPPLQLLQIHKICNRFQGLQSASCLRRKSLHVVVNHCLASDGDLFERTFFAIPYQQELLREDGSKEYPETLPSIDQYLQYQQLELEDAKTLARIFPNIKHLKMAVILNSRLTDTNDLIYLLNAWSAKLTTLNMCCHYTNNFYWGDLMENLEINANISAQLFLLLGKWKVYLQLSLNYSKIPECINRMTSLRQLALVFSNYFTMDNTKPIDLPILKHLEQFYFFSYDHPKMIMNSLKKYAL